MSRIQYLAKRFLLSIPVVVFGTSLTFLIIRLGPIDPAAAILGPDADPQNVERYERIREQLGLNEPLWEQYLSFMWEMLTFDLGASWVVHPGADVNALLMVYMPRTLWLGFWSVLIALFIGIPLGFYAGVNPNTPADYLASFGGIVWRAMPNFWLAIILAALLVQSERFLFGFNWTGWLIETNVIGTPDLENLHRPSNFLAATKQIFPAALVLGSASMGNEMRIGRTAVLETINSNYVDAARAKGVSGGRLIWKHVFRNALIPLIPVITSEAFLLIGGSVLVEVIFGINGLGWLFFEATIQGDIPLAGSLMFFFIVLIVGVNVLQDVLYTVIDPRVGYERT